MKLLFISVLIGALSPIYSRAQEMPLVVQDIVCRGNNSTSCQFIASHLYLVSGEQLNEEEIQNARLRLSALPNFKSVDIHLEKGFEKGRAIVVIDVTEASPITKEFAIGSSYRQSRYSQNIAGRVNHQNLFGTGKILGLEVLGQLPVDESTRRTLSTRLQFVDPNLLESKKFFLISGLSYLSSVNEFKNGNSYFSEQLGLDASLGRRFGDFSYLTLGFQYRPTSKIEYRSVLVDGTTKTDGYSYRQVYFLSYGWNSEDDPYFPTQGSRLNLGLGWSADVFVGPGAAFRTTWSGGSESFWTFKVGGSPGTEYRPRLDEDLSLSLAYSRTLENSDGIGGIERGRWYVEPGLERPTFGSSPDFGLKAGVRLETKAWGIVDLYFIGSTDRNSWGGK